MEMGNTTQDSRTHKRRAVLFGCVWMEISETLD